MKMNLKIALAGLAVVWALSSAVSCDDWKFHGSGTVTKKDTTKKDTAIVKKDTVKYVIPDNGKTVSSMPFESAKDNHIYYRIPALIETPRHAILAFCEARNTEADFYAGHESMFTVTPAGTSKDRGDIDLVVKRSEDGGATWSAMQTIVNDQQNTCGNPVPVVEPTTGRIWLFWCWHSYPTASIKSDLVGSSAGIDQPRRIFSCYSDDDGKTWSAQTDMTSKLEKSDWTWLATGPGHGVVKTSAPNKGRIMIPANHRDGNSDNYSHCYYSDDKGATWNIGGSSALGGNESQIAEIKSGILILHMRLAGSKVTYRGSSYSTDGGANWGTLEGNTDLPDPGCQGSISMVPESGMPSSNLLVSNARSSSSRSNMCISKSTDAGKTWAKAYTVYASRAAYSDMIVLSDGSVAVLYEYGNGKYGTANPNEYIGFQRIPKSIRSATLGL
jgi:sialidase-1